MSLDLKGQLITKLPLTSGEGRNGKWEKQEFVIETEEQYPRKICISLWGDKIKSLESIHEGDRVNVSVNIESREYNGRWYTDVRAWRLQREEGNVPPLSPEDLSTDTSDPMDEEGDLPF